MNMDRLFAPRSVLVVGASAREGNLAANIVRNLLGIGFTGRLWLYGRSGGHLAGHPIRSDWAEFPPDIDLAVILVPAPEVAAALEQCGQLGIRWAVVETGGFSELSESGRTLEAEVRSVAQRHGIRFTGPNGVGVLATEGRLAVPFLAMPRFPRPGRLHLLIQSGGVGLYLLNRLLSENLGLGSFVSMGNKLDLDECDLLDYLRTQQPTTVGIYLEDIRNGRRFFEATRDYPCPILVQKASVSQAGSQAAASHTAAVAVDDRVLDAVLRQNRVTRVAGMKTMVNHAKAFSLPLLKGPRLLLISRSGGHAVIAADLAEQAGFTLPPLPAAVEEAARRGLRARVVSPRNPLDLGDVFDFEVYRQILEQGLASPEIDGIAFIHGYAGPPEDVPSRKLAEKIAALCQSQHKPIFVCLLCTDDELLRLRQQHTFPIFDSPEDLMAAAAVSLETTRTAQRPRELLKLAPMPSLAEPSCVAELLERAEPGLLPGENALELIRAAGFPVAPFRLARTPAEVAACSASVGCPQVLKLVHPGISHKSDRGGVILNVRTEAEAVVADTRLRALSQQLLPDEPPRGILIQRMEYGFREIFLGARRDPSFGPLVLVGLGGVLVEVFQDVALRLAPLTYQDLDDLLHEPLSFRALGGARHVPPADLAFLRDAILRLARLILEQPRLVELDINPLKLHRAGRGGVVVDARVVVR